MKSPFLIAVGAALVVLLAAFAPALWHMATPPSATTPAPAGLPWQVTLRSDGGSQVFGLNLPGTTLSQLRQAYGDDLRVAVMTGPGEVGALEAYLERHEAGGIAGRLWFAFDADPAALARWRHSGRSEQVDADTRRHALGADALAEADRAPLTGISFMPAGQLDAAAVAARFGEPAERLHSDTRLEHWLYPALGLAVVIDAEGRDLLQYVAPPDFERRLRAPLRSGARTP